MPRSKKVLKMRRTSQIPYRLFFGTSERVAKMVPVVGILPEKEEPICLSTVYPGFFAFFASETKARWGIIEVDSSLLKEDAISPYHRLVPGGVDKWRKSLDEVGVCHYSEAIPTRAILRVTIYEPTSNMLVTGSVLNSGPDKKLHKSTQSQHFALTKWLIGESVELQEWIGDKPVTSLSIREKEKIEAAIFNKMGLDIFYSPSEKDRAAS